MPSNILGQQYADGQTIVRQGEMGNCMFVIQQGRVAVVKEESGRETRLAVLEAGDFFGEMALFEQETRSATVRALGPARILTVDRRTFLRRVKEDPTLAFEILKHLSQRIRHLNAELTKRPA